MSIFDDIFQIRRTRADVLISLGILIIGVPAIVLGVGALGMYLYFVVVPPPVVIPEAQVASVARTSHIYAADGTLLAALHAEHNREPIKLSQMPKHLQDAVVAAEDARFYDHRGLDVRAIIRALFADLRAGSAVQGGSTITQQYVKNAYVGKKKSFLRKVRESLVASQLERKFSKKEILEDYLNTAYFGRGAYGVEAAAQTFFEKPASKLTVSQSALLAGLIPSPTRFSPHEHPVEAERRRRYVLDRMQDLGFIDPGRAEAARREFPQFADPKKQEEVFRYPYFVDAVKRYLLDEYGEARLFSGGLEVQATIDPRMQELADKAVQQALPAPGDPHASLVSIEPNTGYVKAIVGGRDYETEKFNLAIQGRRQPGSAFKPFVLVTALEDGVLPSDRYNGPGKYCGIKGYRSKDGCIHNFDNSGFGNITVEKATINSVNTVYIQMANKVGTKRMIEVARRMGISRRSLQRDENNLAIALGGFTLGVTPMEMASGFATLAARGVYREPKLVTKVTDVSGRTLESGPSKPVKALDQAVADNVTAILKKVITQGTARRANINRPAAGKTGTSQDFTNAWFIGYTPELSTSVWVGFPKDTRRKLLNIRGVSRVVGGSIPSEVWAAFMKPALEGVVPSEFAEPEPIGTLELPFRPEPIPSFTPSPVEEYTPPPFDPNIFAPPEPSPSPTPAPSSRPLLPGLFGGQ